MAATASLAAAACVAVAACAVADVPVVAGEENGLEQVVVGVVGEEEVQTHVGDEDAGVPACGADADAGECDAQMDVRARAHGDVRTTGA